jgi:hypothetical protein
LIVTKQLYVVDIIQILQFLIDIICFMLDRRALQQTVGLPMITNRQSVFLWLPTDSRYSYDCPETVGIPMIVNRQSVILWLSTDSRYFYDCKQTVGIPMIANSQSVFLWLSTDSRYFYDCKQTVGYPVIANTVDIPLIANRQSVFLWLPIAHLNADLFLFTYEGVGVRIMMFNATFNNISVISWWSVL